MDAQWVQAMLERHEALLLRYAAGITGDIETARDVVQEAFIKLCKADRDGIEDHITPWLYTVVRNRALNLRRKEARMAPLLDLQVNALDNGEPNPREKAAEKERSQLVSEALASLPEKEQEACRLKFQTGMTYREISGVMGVSLGSVNTLIHRGLGAVRLYLKPHFDLRTEG